MRISDWSSDVCSSDLHRAHRLRCDLRVKGGGVECGMTEHHLDDADIDAILEQVRGEAVAQGVRSDTLVDIRGLGCLYDDPIELARADRRRSALAREEPAIRKEDDRKSAGWGKRG